MSDNFKADFEIGLNFLFSKWEALNLTLEYETAGEATKELIDDFRRQLLDWFFDDDVDSYDLEKWMTEVIVEDIGIEFEDGSITEIAVGLCKLQSTLKKTGKSVIIDLAKKEAAELKKREEDKQKQQDLKRIDEKVKDEMDLVEEDDGWEEVKPKNRKHK